MNSIKLTIVTLALFLASGAQAASGCITFSAEDAFCISVRGWSGSPEIYLECSVDGSVWNRINFGTKYSAGEQTSGVKYKLHVRGKNNSQLSSIYTDASGKLVIDNVVRFNWESGSRKIACSGNLGTLLDYRYPEKYESSFAGMFEEFWELTEAPSLPSSPVAPYGCYLMFKGCKRLKNAPSLPSTSLATNCYASMFSGCTSLTAAPALHATALAEGCYSGMFRGCTSLKSAPALPATMLAEGCYSGMFKECTSLTVAPALPATTLAEDCYSSMFEGCMSLTTPPESIPATTLPEKCCSMMFSGCTSLKTAPQLPATQLAERCYDNMFSGCASLKTAPQLPATQLAERCYDSMFSGCTSLKTPPELPATNLHNNCYASMFSGCTSLTEAPALPAMKLMLQCYASMFSGCTSLAEAPALPAMELMSQCYASMFSGCTSLLTMPQLPATDLHNNCYASMFAGCTSLKTAPQLPATQLAERCYDNMFSGCTALTEPPLLPAKNMLDYCYNMMFKDCTSLKALPVLPVTNLANSCYLNMFAGCSSLVVNASGPGRKWNIPVESTTASRWGEDMFADTGGTVRTPELNRTYYIASASPAFSLTVQEVAHATYRVFTNETVEVFAPYVMLWGDEVKVVYTADDGYGFRNSSSTVRFYATAEEMQVPAELLPDAPDPMLPAVEYVDADGVLKTTSALVLTKGSRSTCYEGWYVVTNEVSFEAGVRCEGVVNLILADGAKLTASGADLKAGVEVVGRGNGLVVYGQRDGTGELDAQGGRNGAGIGGNSNSDEVDGSYITINGGIVKATGGVQGAGIGGSAACTGANITINGGTVTATSCGWGGAGIGGGSYGVGANITINGGIVTATGGTDGAGIGGGAEAGGSDITINGGAVTATGDYGSAGIGGGYFAPGENIFINGGTVTATGGINGSGIGAGEASMTAASGIFAADGVTVRAGASENPTEVIPHASGTTDLADALAYKRYVTAEGAAPAPAEFTVNGDVLSLGSGKGWTYDAGTKVLTLDGTADGGAYALAGSKLDNSVFVDVSPATECRVTLSGVALGGPATTRNLIQVTKGTVRLDVAGAVTFEPGDGHKAIGVSAGATLYFAGSGTVAGWSVDVVAGGRLVLEGVGDVKFASEAAAAAAAQYAPATRPNADVEKVVSAEDYAKMFRGVAVPSGTLGLWSVGHDFTAATADEIRQALEAAETLGGIVGTVTSDTPQTAVQTKAGLYYGMAGAAEVGDIDAAAVPAGKWTLGDGQVRDVAGEKPAGANGKAFYRLKVTAEP